MCAAPIGFSKPGVGQGGGFLAGSHVLGGTGGTCQGGLLLQQYHPPRPLCTSPIFQYTPHIAQKCKNFFKMTDNSKKDSLWQQHPVTAPRCVAFYLVSPWLQKSIFPLCLQQFSKFLGQILCGRRADLAAARQQLF